MLSSGTDGEQKPREPAHPGSPRRLVSDIAIFVLKRDVKLTN